MKHLSKLFVSTALFCVSAAHAQTLGTAANYDILIQNGGTAELKDANQLFGQVGISNGALLDGKNETTNFTGTIHKHSGGTIKDGGGLNPSGGILTGAAIDSALNQANADVTSYINYLNGLTADVVYGTVNTSFSYSTSAGFTVLDFTKIDLSGETFTLTGSAGGTDSIIIRTSDFLEFNASDLILNNLDPNNIVWYHAGTSNFDLHKSDKDPANFMEFAGTIIAPNAQVRIGEVAFNGRVIGSELKFGSGFIFEEKPPEPPNPPNPPNPPVVIPEPSSSLMLIIGAVSLMLVRRRKQ